MRLRFSQWTVQLRNHQPLTSSQTLASAIEVSFNISLYNSLFVLCFKIANLYCICFSLTAVRLLGFEYLYIALRDSHSVRIWKSDQLGQDSTLIDFLRRTHRFASSTANAFCLFTSVRRWRPFKTLLRSPPKRWRFLQKTRPSRERNRCLWMRS